MSNSSLSSLESDQSELPEIQALVNSIISKLSFHPSNTNMTVKGKVKKDRSSKERKDKQEISRHFTYDRATSSEVIDSRTFLHDPTEVSSASGAISVDPSGNLHSTDYSFSYSQEIPVAVIGNKRVRDPIDSPPWKGKKLCDANEIKALGNNSDDESQTESPEAIEASVRKLEKILLEKRGWKIHRVKSDGACLFRSVSHQIFGDEEHHHIIRQHVMDYMQKNRDHFCNFILEDFDRYISRKREDSCFGNHVEIQAICELYNRPLEIYRDSIVPMNVHHEGYKDVPIRLSYHSESHYNSIVDPYSPAVGQGLGMPKDIQPPLPEKDLVDSAVKASDDLYTEELLLQKVIKETEEDDLNAAIAHQTIQDSYSDFIHKKTQKITPNVSKTGPCCSSTQNDITCLETKLSSHSQGSSHHALSSQLLPSSLPNPSKFQVNSFSSTCTASTACASVPHKSESQRGGSPVLKSVPLPESQTVDDALLRFMPEELFGMDDEDVLAFALAQSRHDYLVSLQQRRSEVIQTPTGSSHQEQPSTSK